MHCLTVVFTFYVYVSARFGKYKKVANRLMMPTVVGGEDYDRLRALSFPNTDVCASFTPKYWCNNTI